MKNFPSITSIALIGFVSIYLYKKFVEKKEESIPMKQKESFGGYDFSNLGTDSILNMVDFDRSKFI